MGMFENEIMAKDLAAGMCEVRNREIVPNLRAQRQELTARIQKIDMLLTVLEKNPDFAKMFDLARELI